MSSTPPSQSNTPNPPSGSGPAPLPSQQSRLGRAKGWFSGLSEAGKITLIVAVMGGAFGVINAFIPVLADSGKDDKSEDASKPSAQAPKAPGLSPSGSSQPPSDPSVSEEPPPGPRVVYEGRTLKLRTPRSNNCVTSAVDFDRGQATTGDETTPDDAEIALQRCISFGLWMNTTSAGVSTAPVKTEQQCLEYANQGGLVSVDSYEQLRDEDPIRRGSTLCLVTAEGRIVRAVVQEVRWSHLDEPSVEWAVDYTFKATVWEQ
ncbi:hypothetical protein E5082_29200 [Streptomyces griseoluteus]|uniref:Uncharacterized protein n=1 Tax=Streptomyces griseoluteus TaxID=29306 RepID=A0A4Z1D0R2_STRGP|nr:hypothetical protein [Streptomyces griseoluteus]TGN75346.1 hypothetical protein E5082_29200 [Streptomyces griseoluteus]GHF30503.1 hypothetical protein GCM10017776_56140 [Streptomyces griseoluteus]